MIRMNSKLLFRLILCLMLPGSLRASDFLPAIPPSDRVITVQEVRNFWINQLLRLPIPTKPSGLYPQEQAAWRSRLNARKATLTAIESGHYGTEAKIVQLTHNAHAWRLKGNETEAKKAETELRNIELHLAKLATLSLQREAAQAQIDSAERIRAIEAEVSTCRQ